MKVKNILNWVTANMDIRKDEIDKDIKFIMAYLLKIDIKDLNKSYDKKFSVFNFLKLFWILRKYRKGKTLEAIIK